MNKLTLLIVDDNEMERDLLKRLLSTEYNLKSANNGIEALNILKNKYVDVVLTDIVMPEMDGLELLQRIRENPAWEAVGVLVATSYKEKTERKALELGADDVIAKPYDPIILKRRVANIDAKKKIEEALKIAEEANRSKSRFLSSMSHDIRTPMNAIIGMTQLALDNIHDKNQIEESLNIINNSSHHLLQLINDILDMSRIESGKMTLTKKEFSHTKQTMDVVTRTMALTRVKNIRFKHSISLIHDLCIGDVQRTNRILDNILGNAIKFTPEGGCVSFSIEEIPSNNEHIPHYRFIVSDTGIGMEQDTIKHIFEPFYRNQKIAEDKIEGTGLGMSIVKNTVDLAGGVISVDSELGKGTTFIVELPFEVLANDKIDSKNNSEYDEYELSGLKVLLVEDHPINQQVAKKILEKEGMHVAIANNGKEAVDLMKKEGICPFDIILMDVQMPVMDGYEATKIIRSIPDAVAKRVPIIAMTANAFTEDIKRCMEAGMNEHVSKPIDAKKLYTTIGKYTGSPLRGTDKRYRQNILVVDDIEINIAVLEAALQEKYEIISATDGVEALQVLSKHPEIVAVITDIQMPNMNGLELIKRIRQYKKYDHIAILANTQYGDVTQEEVLLKAGADDFVYKPTTPAIVITRLHNVLKNYII